jgi:hypothetical protein
MKVDAKFASPLDELFNEIGFKMCKRARATM